MSVKGKVKRLNREVEYLKHINEFDQECHKREITMLENIIKFFVMNQVGEPADGGVHIEEQYVDKFDNLEINIWYEPENKAYVIKFKDEENIKLEESLLYKFDPSLTATEKFTPEDLEKVLKIVDESFNK